MKIKIPKQKSSYVFFRGKEYLTGEFIDISISDAMKLSRMMPVEIGMPKQPYDPKLFHEQKKFGIVSDVDSVSGWGNATTGLIKFSPQYEISLLGELKGTVDYSAKKAFNRDIEPAGAMIWHEQPKANWINSNFSFSKNIAIVPFETTKIPASWIERINTFDALLVPCQQNIEAFRASGVKVPIDLIHWGVDESIYFPLERASNRPFTFGTMGSLSIRKGTDLLVEAFSKAFPNNENVRLICKTSAHGYFFMSKDKRIKVEMTAWTYEELIANFFKQVDCFVFPTRGEGFGMPPLEAMATGLPAIVTGWSGPLEYMNEEVGWLIDHKMAPATNFSEVIYKEECGDWAEPSLEHLIALLRHAYEHQDEVKKKGEAAAKHVRENWLWKDKIKMFHGALNKFL